MTTVRSGSATALWQELIREGEQRRHLALGEELESYLVFALMRHLGDGHLGARVMALEWLTAHEPPMRPDHLRDVGDRCLLIAGLFPRLAQRRRVDTRYYVDLGRGAYSSAASRAPRCERTLFDRLAEAFGSLVSVLAAIRPDARRECLPVEDRAVVLARRLH
jgi:hypothetical protein